MAKGILHPGWCHAWCINWGQSWLGAAVQELAGHRSGGDEQLHCASLVCYILSLL